MKITKKELMRIIKEEVNKARVKRPVDEKRSVDATSASIMEMSARIDGMERGMQEAIRRIYEALDVIIDILPDDIAADIPLELPSFYLPTNLEEENKE